MSSGTELPEAVENNDGGFDEVILALATPECRQDPYRLYARMRREDPVYRSSQGIWYLTRYADVEAALRDLRLSNDGERMTRALAARQGAPQRFSRLTRRLGRVMTTTDPPDHARLRRLVSKAFTARRVQGLRPRLQAIVDGLLDAAVAAGSTMDLIAALASPLPGTVICELFGIPRGDTERVRAWFHQLRAPNTVQGVERIELMVEQFEGYLTDLIRRRRARPADDILSALVTVAERDDQLTDEELLSTCLMLVTAGDQATTDLIGNGTLALLRHPDQLRRLQRDPTLIRSAVDELVRYDSPSQIIIRVVAEAVEIGGRTLAEGELVHLVLAATNRDPERFPDPDQLDLGRPDNRHLSFGNGPHFCLGAPLARLAGEVAIGTLIRRLPGLRLSTETVQWKPNPMLRGPACLPVAY
ncbi:MAG: cytochrome P450 [Pseudonocardiales bacterium]|nr:cytochrome P450 [Pseudonocardiales bacterium]MBV9029227.1 cytochrome P450 [Pseudonocardiales bacterium]MBW0009718.1 cytochrome P450 [Pseudonocardiales bacterium]